MEGSMVKVVEEVSTRGNNRRIVVTLIVDEKGDPFFSVQTKRLIDFKKREISTSKTLYSVETFMVMKELLSFLIDQPKVMKTINPFLGFDSHAASHYIGRSEEL